MSQEKCVACSATESRFVLARLRQVRETAFETPNLFALFQNAVPNWNPRKHILSQEALRANLRAVETPTAPMDTQTLIDGRIRGVSD